MPDGPNGLLIPEIHEIVPEAQYVARNGEVNAWDVAAFRDAVKATGRKTVIISGVITAVCVAEPAISAHADGYKAFAVIDASGTYSKLSEEITVARLAQAGVVPIDTVAILSEIQKTWNRPEAMEFAGLYATAMPHYQLLIESYQRAQAAVSSPVGA